MENHIRASSSGSLGWLRLVNIVFCEGDSSDVLHGPPVKLGNNYLIVLREGILLSKKELKELDSTHHSMEEFIVLKMRSQALPAVSSHRYKLLVSFKLVFELSVRPCTEGIQIGRDGWCLLEDMDEVGRVGSVGFCKLSQTSGYSIFLIKYFFAFFAKLKRNTRVKFIDNDLPVFWSYDSHLEWGF